MKTGTDPGADQVNLSPVDSTIANLVAVAARANSIARVSPTENTTYRLHATLTSYKAEADSDYHLVLTDGSRKMIAEIPSPPCEAGGPFLDAIKATRAAFDAKLPPGNGFHTVNIAVTITGVGFFDRLHGQTGASPNGVELHPVISITFG